MGLYYSNTWSSQNFPFLSQLLFDGSSNSTNYVTYNQSAILNSQFEIDEDALRQQGIPWLTGLPLNYLTNPLTVTRLVPQLPTYGEKDTRIDINTENIQSNMGLTAAFTHMLLWNYDDIKAGWSWASASNLKKMASPQFWRFWENQETPEQRMERKAGDPNLDPHYKLMLQNLYPEVPLWWWGAVLLM